MTMNVLISSAGRRVGLADCFRQSFLALGVRGRIIAIDTTPYAPACQHADAYYLVPKCMDARFMPEVMDICELEDVNLIVPTIDTELSVYAGAKLELCKAGVHVGISSPETVAICNDKVQTHVWLASHGFPVLRQSRPELALSDRKGWEFPLVVKPRDGSASLGVRFVQSFAELETVCRRTDDLIVQQIAPGAEHTINVFVDRESRCLSAVPHLRMEVRGGEVSKGMTVRDVRLISLARDVVETLPGAYGTLNLQCFLAPDGEVRIIEINARFGGGYPLAHRAGAHFTTWLLEEVMGRPPSGPFDDWENGLVMLRYDQALFVNNDTIGCNANVSNVSSVYRIRSRRHALPGA